MSIRDNIIKLYILRALLWFMISMPIIVVFFQLNNLTLTEVFILQGIYSFTIAIIEIPSGYFADYFGRKKSLIFSTFCMFLGYLIFSNYSGFEIYIIAQVLIAIGGSLISGADSAIMYDTLIQIDKKGEYTKVEGRTYAIGNFSESVAALITSIILISSPLLLPIQIQTFIIFLTIPLCMTLVEPKINKHDHNRGVNILTQSIKVALIKNSKLRWYILFSASMGIASLSAAWLAQPFFQVLNIPLVDFGLLWASLNLIAGLGSYKSHNIEKKFDLLLIIKIIGFLMFILFLLIYLNINYFGLLFIYIIYYLRGIITPILKNQINLLTESNIRATVMSIRSFILRITYAILAPILGYFAENNKGDFGISYSFLIISLVILFLSFISIINLKDKN